MTEPVSRVRWQTMQADSGVVRLSQGGEPAFNRAWHWDVKGVILVKSENETAPRGANLRGLAGTC